MSETKAKLQETILRLRANALRDIRLYADVVERARIAEAELNLARHRIEELVERRVCLCGGVEEP